MTDRIRALLSRPVKDIATTDVAVINESDSLAKAAELFERRGITGAPVVDVRGKCVGVLTSADFARRERLLDASESLAGNLQHRIVANDSSPVHVEPIRDDRVGEFMTRAVQTISSDTPLIEAARIFLAEHIHHLVIVDTYERPVGILTTTDIVRCVVELADNKHEDCGARPDQ